MKTNLDREINCDQDAEQFLQELIDNNEHYHPEEDAHDIEWLTVNCSFEEAEKLNGLMTRIYDGIMMGEITKDPCEYILDNIEKLRL